MNLVEMIRKEVDYLRREAESKAKAKSKAVSTTTTCPSYSTTNTLSNTLSLKDPYDSIEAYHLIIDQMKQKRTEFIVKEEMEII